MDIQNRHNLTDRQLEVLTQLAKGYSNSEISKILYITVHTVKAHIAKIYETLKVNTRVQAAVAAIALNLVDIDDLNS